MPLKPVRISEGITDIFVYRFKTSSKGPGEKTKLPFYNPTMELNRDISILVCQWHLNNRNKHLSFLDGLAASGIRGIRLANELKGDFSVTINDWDEQAYKLIQQNLKHLNQSNISAENKNLNSLLSDKQYDYIDIDPFGSPISYLDGAMRSIKNHGIIAVTATDAATLCGTYPKACQRRYNATPLHGCCHHETGIRILLGVLCREAAKYNKGITPILSYYQDHYFRIYVQLRNGKKFADQAQIKHQRVSVKDINYTTKEEKQIGPLWLGPVHNKNQLTHIREHLFKKPINTKPQLIKLFDLWIEEATLPPFYYTTDDLASYLKTSPVKINMVIQRLNEQGFKAARTHFDSTGLKTTAPLEKIIELIRNTG